jgi:hypothetical protein
VSPGGVDAVPVMKAIVRWSWRTRSPTPAGHLVLVRGLAAGYLSQSREASSKTTGT